MIKALDVLKHCDLVAGGYAIDVAELEHIMGWPMGKLAPRIELTDGSAWTRVVLFKERMGDEELEGWRFQSLDGGVALTVYND